MTDSDGHRAWLARALAFSATLASSAAVAQEAVELPTLVVEGVNSGAGPDIGYVAQDTTMGSKTDTPLELIPRSISIVTEQEMADREVKSVAEAIAYVPGVVASPWGADNRFDQFLLRGFDVGSYGIYRDGLPQKLVGWAGFKIDPYGAQRVEVLRGPSAVLYGETDPGGIVNIVTKRPTFDPLRDGYVSYGPFDTVEAGIDVGGPLGQDGSLAYRLTGVYRNGETWLADSVDDRSFIAPALTWAPDDATTLTILTNWQRDETTPAVYLPVAGDEYPVEFGPLPGWFEDSVSPYNRFKSEVASFGYLFEHKLESPAVIRQNLRYSRQETDYTELYFNGMAAGGTDMKFVPFAVDETSTAFTVDNQLELQFAVGATEHTLLLGADYNWTRADGNEGDAPTVRIPVSNPSYEVAVGEIEIYSDGVQEMETYGLYVQDQVQVTERLFASVGVRQGWVNNRLDDRLETDDATQDYDHFAWNLGLVYELTNGIAPYASYSTGFVTNLGRTFDGTLFKPTEAEQFEVGAKYRPLGFDGFFTVALFDITKSNVLTTDPDHVNEWVQTGEVRHRGLELEGNMSLGNGLSAVASYTYIDAKITASNDGDEGNRSSLVPRNAASLWANYDVQGGRFEGVSFGAGARYVGESYGDTTNERVTPAYTVADAALRYSRGKVEGAINVSNLFDEDYFATCYAGGGCTSGDPREIIGTLTFRF